ncbi:hypothetical protein ADL21_04540 [Streptomyces albus subsp. albus]|nr:hypothetical protein ADL21_04540 [Streptomyces albus subsp. albus]
MADRCIPCEEHAKLHSDNWLGFGPANDPCPQCEAHAEMHGGGCGGLLFAALTTCAAALLARKNR